MTNVFIREMRVEDLEPASYNPRRDLLPGDMEYEALKRSIENFGLVDPLIWNEVTKRLVGGHQRLRVLQDLGWEKVSVSVVHLDEQAEKALNIALNKIDGDWAELSLQKLLKELDRSDFDATLSGFSDMEIYQLLNRDLSHLEVEEEIDPFGGMEEGLASTLSDPLENKGGATSRVKIIIGPYRYSLSNVEFQYWRDQVRQRIGFKDEDFLIWIRKQLGTPEGQAI